MQRARTSAIACGGRISADSVYRDDAEALQHQQPDLQARQLCGLGFSPFGIAANSMTSPSVRLHARPLSSDSRAMRGARGEVSPVSAEASCRRAGRTDPGATGVDPARPSSMSGRITDQAVCDVAGASGEIRPGGFYVMSDVAARALSARGPPSPISRRAEAVAQRCGASRASSKLALAHAGNA